jgi:hypothetical protein
VIRVQGDKFRVTVNGKDATILGGQLQKVAAASPITLQARSGPAQFRNFFIRELKVGE